MKIKSIIKRMIKKIFLLFGFDVRKKNKASSPLEAILKSRYGIKEKLVFFDVGAHYGESIIKYRNLFANAIIYSFEPNPESFKVLQGLESLNNKIYNFGFSNKSGKFKFNLNNANVTDSLLSLTKDAQKVYDNPNLLNIQKVYLDFETIDEFITRKKIKTINFLKIDVQGAEYKVLQGARTTLESKRIELIQLEYIFVGLYQQRKSLYYYLDFLANFGYELISIIDIVYSSDGRIYRVDLIFSLS